MGKNRVDRADTFFPHAGMGRAAFDGEPEVHSPGLGGHHGELGGFHDHRAVGAIAAFEGGERAATRPSSSPTTLSTSSRPRSRIPASRRARAAKIAQHSPPFMSVEPRP